MCACVSLSFTNHAWAQEEMKPKKMEGHTWHQVAMVKFEPGMADSAMNIIDDHFMKAGMAMQSDSPGPQIMRLRSGEWDMLMVWTMESIEDMEWERSPDDIEWWQQLVEQEGSEEKASKLMETYNQLVANSTTYLATTKTQVMEGETMGAAANPNDPDN
jgi:hypothetical protein